VPEDEEVANVILQARDRLEELGATVVDVSIPDYATVSNTSVISYEFARDLDTYLAATPAAPFRTLQEIYDHPTLWHPSLNGVLTSSLANRLKEPDYHDRLAGRELFKAALVKAMDDDDLDALIYPTIRQKPVLVPSTSQPGSNCRVSAQSGLPAISVPAGFTPAAADSNPIPVGMEFLGREFTEGKLLQFAYSWEQATHIRQVPPSTPPLEPDWQYRVTDGTAEFHVSPSTRQLRFTAPDLDTFVYVDPAMHDLKGTLIGEFRDDRWHVRYAVPTRGQWLSVVWVDDMWDDSRAYTLFGRARAE
jgi:hypothetical protein